MIRTVTWDRDLDILVMKSLFGHLCGCLFLNEGEERLAVDLVCSDKVDNKGEIKEEQRERERERRESKEEEKGKERRKSVGHTTPYQYSSIICAISTFKYHISHDKD